jgi:hypothetical protein
MRQLTRQGDCVVTIATFLAHKYGRTVDGCRSMAGLLEKVFRSQYQELEPDQFEDVLKSNFYKAKTYDQFVRYVKQLQKDDTLQVREIAQKVRQKRRRPQKRENPQDQVNLFHAERKAYIEKAKNGG